MKPSEYAGLLAAIWIAPYQPDIYNLIVGVIVFVYSLYLFSRGK